jgi:ubiquitin-protein ligase
MAQKRLNKELDDMRKDIPEFFESVDPVHEDIFEWQAIF